MTVYMGVWGALALGLLMLAIYRKMKARAEDDTLHVSGSNWGVIDKQEHMAQSMSQIDRVGVVLTVVTVLYGLVLVGIYFTGVFEQGQKIIN